MITSTKFRFFLQEALSNLASLKLRSALTILGICIGTASVVAMISSGQLASRAVLAQFSQLGTNLFSVSIFPTEMNKIEKQWDSLYFKHNLKQEIINISQYQSHFLPVDLPLSQKDVTVISADPELAKLIHLQLKSGRFFTKLDKNNPYCILGYELTEQLKKQGWFNFIGKQILISGRYFTIIGIAQPWPENSFFNQNIDNSILISPQSLALVTKTQGSTNFLLQLNTKTSIDKLEAKLSHLILNADPTTQFFFRSAKQIVDSLLKQKRSLTWLLAFISSISLLVSGAGIMNIMLVCVTERKKEIGIRKAVGACQKDIRTLFLLEALLLSVFGGLLGVILGVIASFCIAHFAHWTYVFLGSPLLLGLGISCLIGIFFGYYPAKLASMCEPIEALRSD